MFFRRGVRNDEWLSARIALFTAGALLAVVGMVLRNDWVIGAAGLVLAAGIAVRFIPRGDEPDDSGTTGAADPPSSSG